MARDFFAEQDRASLGQQARGGLQQVRAMLSQISTIMGQAVAVQQKVQAGVATGAFDQADLDRINAVLTLWTKASGGPVTPQQMIASLLADASWGM